MINREPLISEPWTGQDGRLWRDIKYWVGVGWSASFLQYQDDLGNWVGY